MSDTRRQWLPHEQWLGIWADSNDLFRYANNSFDDVAVTKAGYSVADLKRSRLLLHRNQTLHGYCVLVAKAKVAQPHHMHPPERRLFYDDLNTACAAIEQVCQPLTLNLLSLGSQIPHLHIHIVPRYEREPAPSAALDSGLAHMDYEALVEDLREAMGFIRQRVSDPLLAHFLDNQGRVVDWPARRHQDKQMAVRFYLASKFEYERHYTEAEVNALLNQWATFEDWALLRRELVMYHLLDRAKDGSAYWRIDDDAD